MSAPIIPIFDVPDYEAEVLRGANAIMNGGVVVLPTETVYGAAGLLSHPAAKARLQALRGGEAKPFTVHLSRRADAMDYLGPVGELGQRLMKKLWPGPVGLTFDVPAERRAEVAGKLNVAESDLYESGTITLRCPDHLVTTDMIGEVTGPVVLTIASADVGGQNLKMDSLAHELGDKVDLIFDAGPTRYSKPSTLLKVGTNRYEIVRVGVYDERIIERLLKTTILFVCSGNTCRSPMAEGIARHVLTRKMQVSEMELEKRGVNVISAGSFATPGSRATPAAVEAMQGMGIDLTRHRSRPLTVELIHQADAIYTMAASHAHAVRALVPSAADKVQTLNPNADVEDPIGSDVGVYRELARELTTLIETRLEEQTAAGVIA